MEIVILLLLFAVIYLITRTQNSLEQKVSDLSRKIDLLKTEITRLSKQASPHGPAKPETPVAAVPEPKVAPKPASVPDVSVYARPSAPAAENTEKQETAGEKPATDLAGKPEETIKPAPQPANIPAPSPVVQRPVQRPPVKPKEKEKNFFEKYPDLEKFIGENLINKIGIAILVLGIGFFVKYAIDQEWINEIGRVAIGILCGGILLGFAHRIRKDFKAFSSVLVGGGMAVFYFTITIAFHEYHIFSQTAAFIIMIFITAFTVLFSITYDRIELAVLAIIGGFASPFMVSTGEGNYIVLFTYILTLNIGMLVLAYYKKWNLVNYVAYVFTILLYGGWLTQKVNNNPQAPYAGALIFGTLFYVVFFLMNVINNIRENRKFIAGDLTILISNTFLYYSAGMFILKHINDGMFQGLFTALIAVFNFIFAYTLYKTKKADSNVVYLLIGLVLTFVSLAAPVQLKGNYITLFWALEAVLLLWLSQKSGIKIIKAASLSVTGLMIISLIMDWKNIYSGDDILFIIINKGFVTSFVSAGSLILTILLIRKEKEEMFFENDRDIYKNFLLILTGVLIYLSGLLELNYQIRRLVEPASLRTVIIGSYNLAYILLLMIISRKNKLQEIRLAGMAAGAIGVFIFITYYNIAITILRDNYLIEKTASLAGFLYHYIDTALAVILVITALNTALKEFDIKSAAGKILMWYFTFIVIVIASVELDHIVLLFAYETGDDSFYILKQNHKIGFPILWGIFSFGLMILGMNKKIKDLRIISLSLFTITLLKLFIVDIRGISEGGKIAAFICLGLLLLIISFMYQKLKKLVTDDEPRNNA
jgi:uncharacterized membrane protein